MISLPRPARALAILLAVLLTPSLAVAAHGPSTDEVVIPASSINPETIVLDATQLFLEPRVDFILEDDGTMYVQTGDIPAMWLRDSSAQAKPYVRFASQHPKLATLVRQVIERNAKNVLTDPYANAFTAGYKIWEEKWEVDSLAYPVTLAYTYWRRTGDRTLFTARLHWALQHTVSTLACEQQHATCSHYKSRFLMSGRGADFAYTGMIWGAFRPSDDAARYPYNIPQQMFAVVGLRELAELASSGYRDAKLADAASRLATEVDAGIQHYGEVYAFDLGWIYAYEVDGRGNTLLMDDANVPNLISATFYGYASPDSALYANTRRLALSSRNPYYYSGKYATGLGSPHTPTGWVWPLGLIAQGLTAQSSAETASTIAEVTTTARRVLPMHESFDPNDPDRFTRADFGWADALYAELIFRSAAGFDPDPLPATIAAGVDNKLLQTPLVVEVPQLWLNAAACYVALARLLQEPVTYLTMPSSRPTRANAASARSR